VLPRQRLCQPPGAIEVLTEDDAALRQPVLTDQVVEHLLELGVAVLADLERLQAARQLGTLFGLRFFISDSLARVASAIIALGLVSSSFRLRGKQFAPCPR
jgi:hypothetical protein